MDEMKDVENEGPSQNLEEVVSRGKAVSRRDFLKIAGVAGAAVGVGAAFSGILAGCGGAEETTTTTAAAATTTTAGATTTTAGATTTVSAGPETGREIKIGFVDPLTGGIAAFGIPGQYCAERWREAAGDGMVFGDGKKHPVNIVVKDSQSDGSRAAQVAGDLITQDKVDIIFAAATPDTVNPVADQAEALECPCISCDCPMEPYYFGRGATPDKPFKWTYHMFWGLTELVGSSMNLWAQIETNKKVGAIWPNDPDGNAFRPGYIAAAEPLGYTIIDAGPYQTMTEDFTFAISEFKKAGCEILTGVPIPPDFTNFWKQAMQQGWQPKLVDVAKPALFPTAMEAIGAVALGIGGPSWWHPTYPFKSSLTGETCQEMALDFEKRTNQQWQQPLLHYIMFEAAVDALKRTKNLDDKQELIANIASIKLADSLAGPIDFTAPVKMGTLHPVPNVVSTPHFAGQWMKGTQNPWDIKAWQFDLIPRNNIFAPILTVPGPYVPMPITS
jgi:branched-chain amino acid transport system substrate-binding protein